MIRFIGTLSIIASLAACEVGGLSVKVDEGGIDPIDPDRPAAQEQPAPADDAEGNKEHDNGQS